jgi:hypothetical protein
MKKLSLIAALLMVCMSGTAASATQTPVDISAEANSSWCGLPSPGVLNCSTYPSGTQSYDGVTFDIPTVNNGWFAWVASDEGAGQASVTIPVNVANVKTVYTLINTMWGSTQSGLLTITFTGSNGAKWTYDLIGGTDIRDSNNGSYTDTIDCRIAAGAKKIGTVAAWNNGENQRLDMQIFELPGTFKNQTLTSVTIVDNGNTNVQRSFIAALTVSTTAP